jgi:hypothetical protein
MSTDKGKYWGPREIRYTPMNELLYTFICVYVCVGVPSIICLNKIDHPDIQKDIHERYVDHTHYTILCNTHYATSMMKY